MLVELAFLLASLNIMLVNGFTEEPNYQNALLNIHSSLGLPLRIRYRNYECDECSLRHLVDVNKANVSVVFDTFYPSYFLFIQNQVSGKTFCPDFETTRCTFGENGTYLLTIKNMSRVTCSLTTIEEPVLVYLPIWIWIGALAGAAMVYVLGKFIYKKYYLANYAMQSNLNSDLGNPQVSSSTYLIETEKQDVQNDKKKKKNSRMKSVDVFRGFCLWIMIFVNYGAGGYSLLDHTPWNGLHLADTVFPGFVFIMGISLPLSFKSLGNKQEMRDPNGNFRMDKCIYKIIKRCILLFFFGLLTSNSSNIYLSNLRIMGVLQRFAITYFVCAMIELIYFRINNYTYFDQNSLEINWQTSKFLTIKSYFKELFYYPIQWFIVSVICLTWTLLTYLLPINGCPTGYIGPGGLHMNSEYFNCTGGSANLIDRLILGYNHLYQKPTFKSIYLNEMPHDPEGLLGCLTSCVICYLGMSCGHIIIHYQQPSKRIIRFMAYGVVYGLSALLLCGFSKNDGWMPINKNLWTLSFVLLLAAMSFIVLTGFYVLIDIYDIYSGTPFLYLGRNSITIYISHIVFANYFPLFMVENKHAYILSSNLYGVGLWCLVAAMMNHYKVFINL